MIGVDVGIANFITASDGKQYGSFNGRLRERQKRDREKRRRKAKLRKCLEKKGTPKEKLPATSSTTGQRLIRHVRQSINQAVNLCFQEHEGCQFAFEQLSVASMRHKARAMNASQNLAGRLHDEELRACQNRQEVKALLLKRHEQWKQNFSLVVVQAPVQLGLWTHSETSTDVG